MTVMIYCNFAIGTTSSPFRVTKKQKQLRDITRLGLVFSTRASALSLKVTLSLHIDQEFLTKIGILGIVSVITQ
jgi:hypothetical protein